MKPTFLLLLTLFLFSCKSNPKHTYLVSFKSKAINNLYQTNLQPDGTLIAAQSGVEAYQIAFRQFQERVREENDSGSNRITTSFEVTDPDSDWHRNYAPLGKQPSFQFHTTQF